MFIKNISGSVALSDFRINILLKKIRKLSVNIKSIQAIYEHFVFTNQELTDHENNLLYKILESSNINTIQNQNQFVLKFSVIPRIGIVSPWSSKATDIIRNCGLKSIVRIERGINFRLMFEDDLSCSNFMNSSMIDYLYDKMSETVVDHNFDYKTIFSNHNKEKVKIIDILNKGIKEIDKINSELCLSLSNYEINYLFDIFKQLKRNPTDVEIMMFAQANSEHCRHKIFNAKWIIDNKKQTNTLFQLIKETHKSQPYGTIVAYSDNAAIIEGQPITRFHPVSKDDVNYTNLIYERVIARMHGIIKVETHNHPTAISPFSGASTGVGGEIRDEGSTGRGSKPKIGLSGFTVSNLCIDEFRHEWEKDSLKVPSNISSPLEIMLQGPIGGASFGNEFGRPNILGYFRVFEQNVDGINWGYHKPIMIAGGLGEIDSELSYKKEILPKSSILIQLGGPGFKIGVGGGAASSANMGDNKEELDFNSVQRGNPEMQRRAQEVIDRCWQDINKNPIISIHDVGAGGLSNAFPELVNDSNKGAIFDLSKIPIEDSSLSPSDIWCNESQERYVLAIDKEYLNRFDLIAKREKCPYAIIGYVTDERKIKLVENIPCSINESNIDQFKDEITKSTNVYIDLPLNSIIGGIPITERKVESHIIKNRSISFSSIENDLSIVIEKILSHPTVANKSFLITIADRTVSGLVSRDQMIGPWQIPVSDCAVTISGYEEFSGTAISIGERPQLAIIDSAASCRIALAESITNIISSDVEDIKNIKLSANWMASCGSKGQDVALYNAVKATSDFCRLVGLSIPVGKDSLSMKTCWDDKQVISPVSLIVSAFSSVKDVRNTITPQLVEDYNTVLLLIDIGKGQNRLAGSILSQIYNDFGSNVPDVDDPNDVVLLFNAIKNLKNQNLILSYHDRSDGGLLVSLVEMSLCSRIGITVHLEKFINTLVNKKSILENLFNEEIGVILQISKDKIEKINEILKQYKLLDNSYILAELNKDKKFNIYDNKELVFNKNIKDLGSIWSKNSYHISKLRDNPSCAEEEFSMWKTFDNDPGLNYFVPFDDSKNIALPYIKSNSIKPKVAILREQGCNSHVEMAWAFDVCGFEAIDVHMSDLLSSRFNLKNVHGLIAVGGFSYGDVLGAGGGWANTIRFNPILLDQFSDFFIRENTFSLGVCNGCQMMTLLSDLIPGAENWPRFTKNKSERYESRLVNLEITSSPSIFFSGMNGMRIPIVVAHGEGRADFSKCNNPISNTLISAHYVDNFGKITEQYPYNPNGSPNGLASVTTKDGRSTVIMPHPERLTRNVMFSWNPKKHLKNSNNLDFSPWMRMFQNARVWIK